MSVVDGGGRRLGTSATLISPFKNHLPNIALISPPVLMKLQRLEENEEDGSSTASDEGSGEEENWWDEDTSSTDEDEDPDEREERRSAREIARYHISLPSASRILTYTPERGGARQLTFCCVC